MNTVDSHASGDYASHNVISRFGRNCVHDDVYYLFLHRRDQNEIKVSCMTIA